MRLAKGIDFLKQLRTLQRINLSLSRGSATSMLRRIDLKSVESWEFSGFSQNGEDGVIDVLRSRLRYSNRYFLEIGASDGLENNTAWLAVAHRCSGVWVEGNPSASAASKATFESMNYGLTFESRFVTRENAPEFMQRLLHRDPDVFSLDIDGNDFHVADALFRAGLRPKIMVVEYNSSFGPDASISIPYSERFVRDSSRSNLYYGCSIKAWQRFASRYDYAFVGVESNGVNAFFVDRSVFDSTFLEEIVVVPFRENFAQLREYGAGWQSQFARLKHENFAQVEADGRVVS